MRARASHLHLWSIVSGDNGRLEYSISSGDEDDDFSISTNGTIVTSRALDREQRALYSLVVTAIDQAAPPQQRLSSTVQVRKSDFIKVKKDLFL
jgi:Cadherin domain